MKVHQVMSPPKIKAPSMGRKEKAEIEKQLMRFAHEEYDSKRPKELRLIQIKPQTIMQRGSVLPNLLIKALRGTAYTIFLDYGEDIRFYFFDAEGGAQGASTYPKSEKMLNEMHGKGTTLLKLPKTDPYANLDVPSMELRQNFLKLAQRTCKEFSLALPDLPAFQVMKFKISLPKLRYGIQEQEDYLVIDGNLVSSEIGNIILLRELFLAFFPLEISNEYGVWLGTLWALGIQTPKIRQIYLAAIQNIKATESLTLKALEWLHLVYPKSTDSTPDLAISISRHVLDFLTTITQTDILNRDKIWPLLILWLMKSGLNYLKANRFSADIPIIKFDFLHDFLIFLYENHELCSRYGFELNSLLRKTEIWLSYFTMRQILFAYGSESSPKLPLLKPTLEDSSIPQEQMENLISQRQVAECLTKYPVEFSKAHPKWIKIMVYGLLLHKFYEISCPSSINASATEDTRFTLSLHNHSDWIFYDVKVKFTWNPENRFMVGVVEDSASPIFDISRKIIAKIMPLKPGSGNIQAKLEFRDPFTEGERDSIEICAITVEILKP